MSTSREPSPLSSSPCHSRIKAFPSSPVAPKIVTCMMDRFRLLKFFGVVERCSTLIFARHDGLAVESPVNSQFRIVPRQRPFGGRFVVISCLVEHVRTLGNYAEPMRESGGNPQHVLVLFRKRHRAPMPEGARTSPQIDNYIENFSHDHANQFALHV